VFLKHGKPSNDDIKKYLTTYFELGKGKETNSRKKKLKVSLP